MKTRSRDPVATGMTNVMFGRVGLAMIFVGAGQAARVTA